MADLQSILTDPNYTEANIETKQAIFDKYSAGNADYTNANEDTKAQIRKVYGLEDVAIGSQLQADIDRLNQQDKVSEENTMTGLKTTMAAVSPYATQKAYSTPLNAKNLGTMAKTAAPGIAMDMVSGVPGSSRIAGAVSPMLSKAAGATKDLTKLGLNVGSRVLGPVGMAATAYDAYDVYNDPNATATDYIPPAVGAVASAPLAYKTAQAVAPVVGKATAPIGQLVNKGVQAAIPPSKAVYEAAEAQAKARGAQIANIGRKFALDKLIPGMASKVLGPISAVGGMVVPSASESDYKYQFPITGPAKGSEINQQTGQPWTRAELDAYYTQFPEEPGIIDQLSGFLSEQFSNNK